MSTAVYIQMGKSKEVHEERVLIKDIVQVFCSSKKIQRDCEDICIMNMKGRMAGPYTISAIEVAEQITSKYNDVAISFIGESSMVVSYVPKPKTIGVLDYLKTVFVSLILFFGAGFSIMTFNTDVNTRELFSNLHKELLGTPSSGFTEMELLYSIGIGIGVVFFFNHFNFKKKKQDPTALEVKMCLYENDVETAILDQKSKQGNKRRE